MAKRPKEALSANEDYRSIPPLRDYIDRIGAEQLSFKKFMVKKYTSHYYAEKATIKIGPDGSIECTSRDYVPTKEEADAILAYFATSAPQWPKSIGATDIKKLLPKIIDKSSILFELHSRKDGLIYMVQERRTVTDGSRNKSYHPWTFFSDGQWRNMEPDGALPFWKPKKDRNMLRIMVHEGAKAADYCDRLVNDPKLKKELGAHPWCEELVKYEHWGIIGGAMAPQRADFSELRAAKPSETVYVCDNDDEGKAVLSVFSKLYKGSLKGLKFDQSFPVSFDLGDAFPKALWVEGRYKGATFKDKLEPATWATEEVEVAPGKKGRAGHRVTSEFSSEWFHSIRPELFIHKDWPSTLYTALEFDSRVGPFTHVKEVSALLKKANGSKTATIRYSPAHKPGIWVEDGERFWNTHVPSGIKPEKGDVGPWLEYLDYLVVEPEDRLELMRWCATLIARPDIKMSYGVLMISEAQGIGKSTLGEKILNHLVGKENTSFPSEREIVESNFNTWIARKRLAVVHEIYAGHSSKAYNSLKNIITDQFITVNQKYISEYQISNWIHMFACSNSMRALQLSMDDRRWFVPKLTEEKRSTKYWNEFNDWLSSGGIEKIAWWAGEFLKKNAPVQRSDNSPGSKIKNEMIEESWSPGQTLVAQFLDRVKDAVGEAPVIILDSDMVQLIKDELYEGRHNDRLEKPATLRKIARAKGWFVGEKRAFIREWGTVGVGAKIVSNVKAVAEALPGELAQEGKKPLQVSDFYRKSSTL